MMSKRVVECNLCGEPLSAANDEELVVQLRRHYEREHSDSSLDLETAQETVSREAYDAGDS